MERKLIYICNQDEKVNRGIYFNDACMTEDFGLHCHDFYELEFVLSGECDELVNGAQTHIKPGDVYLLTPSDIHSFAIEKGSSPVDIMSVRFYENDVASSLRKCLGTITMPLIPKLPEGGFDTLYALASAARKNMATRNGEFVTAAELMLEAILHQLLGMKNEYINHGAPEMTYARTAIEYISRNYMNDIGLPDVAEHMSISKCYLSTIITKTFGKSFRDILNIYRLRSAKNLLLSTDKSVTTICYECGYQNFAHFSRVFKSATGISPGEYRRSH